MKHQSNTVQITLEKIHILSAHELACTRSIDHILRKEVVRQQYN